MDFTDVSRNLRPNRHLRFLLSQGHEVQVLSYASTNTPLKGASFIHFRQANRHSVVGISRRLKELLISCGFFGGISGDHYSRILNSHLGEDGDRKYDLAVVENIFLLPAVSRLRNVKNVIFDVREFHPAEFEESLIWRIFRKKEIDKIYSTLLPQVDRLLTVSPGIQSKLSHDYGLRSEVILNVPDVEPVRRTDGPRHPLRLVYHGIVNSQRGLTKQIGIIQKLPEVCLDIYGVGRSSDLRKLNRIVRKTPNATIREPVESMKIVSMLREYDLGLVFYTGANFNLKIALPNKFFEYIYAGVPPIVAPGTTMADFVERTGFGFISDERSLASLGSLLQRISPDDIAAQRQKLDNVLQELSLSNQQRTFLRVVETLGL